MIFILFFQPKTLIYIIMLGCNVNVFAFMWRYYFSFN